VENPYENSTFPDCNDLTIFHMNIRSLRANFDNLLIYLQTVKQKFHAIVLSEIWVDDEESSLYQIKGYNAHFYCRPDKRAGGLAVYLPVDVIAQFFHVHSSNADF
jgi:hypothetical protein